MATKDYHFSPKDNYDNIVGDTVDDKSCNFNLNQNYKCLLTDKVCSNNVVAKSDNRNISNYEAINYADVSNSKAKNFLKKSDYKTFDYLSINTVSDEEKSEEENSSNVNSSTLSLHIAAFEKSVEASNKSNEEKRSKMKVKKLGLIEKWKNLKQIFTDSAAITNLSEFSRQQKNQKSEPEIMQFKASRKLLNPNLSENKNGNKKLCDVISAGEKVSLCAVIGSGGHTGEMSTLLLQLNSDLFIPRHYVVAETDKMGIDKVMEIEKELYAKQKNHSMKADEIFTVTKIPRSREVGQSYFSSIFTTLWAIFSSILAVWRLKPDIIICNGPGTCIPICLIAFFFDLIRLRNTRIIFVESVCRVKTLSLSGKILYTLRIADIFLVQWEDLVKLYPRAEYIGILN